MNPLREAQGFIRQHISNRLFGSLFAELTLPAGFAYRLALGPDLQHFSDGQFQGANVVRQRGAWSATPRRGSPSERTSASRWTTS